MQHYTVDFTSRMKDINASLNQPADDDAAAQQKGALMDELLDIVDDIDHARGEEKGNCNAVVGREAHLWSTTILRTPDARECQM